MLLCCFSKHYLNSGGHLGQWINDNNIVNDVLAEANGYNQQVCLEVVNSSFFFRVAVFILPGPGHIYDIAHFVDD